MECPKCNVKMKIELMGVDKDDPWFECPVCYGHVHAIAWEYSFDKKFYEIMRRLKNGEYR